MSSDSTQFLIDLAAKFTGGTAAVATLADFGDRMLAAGSTAADLTAAVAKTSDALKLSSEAMAVTVDALAAGEAKYRETETAADRAAKAVERIGQMAEAQRGKLAAAMNAGDAKTTERAAAKLAALTARQGEAVLKANAATAALTVEAGALDALKTKAAGAAEGHKAIAAGLANMKSAAEKAAAAEEKAAGSGKVNETAEALGKLGGPLGAAGQKAFGLATGFEKLGKSLGSAGIYVAVAVAIVAIASAALLATVAIAKWAVNLADVNRSQALLAAGVAGTVAGGVELDATIAKLGNVVPQTRDELLGMAGDLAKTGLKGAALSTALEEAAVKAAKLKWGPDFAKQLLSLDSQAARLKTNLGGTFGGLKIEGILEGFSSLVALFDSSTASGKTMKFLFETLFQPIIDAVSDAIPKVERLFLYAEILALKAYIALKPYQGAIKLLAEGFAIAAAVVVGVLGVAVIGVFGMLASMILVPIAAVGLLVAAVIWVAGAIYDNFGAALAWVIGLPPRIMTAITDGFATAVAFVSDLGGKMITGLVNGITGGATAVVNAITGVIGGGIKAAEHLLGIGSPSKRLYATGSDTVAGYVGAVEDGTGEAQGALEDMVAPPKGGAAGGGGGGSRFGDVSLTIVIEGRGETDDALVSKMSAALTDFFEGDALAVGAG